VTMSEYMPDKDYIHTTVKRPYVPLMEALRSKHSDMVEDAIGKGIKADLRSQGDEPVKLGLAIAKYLSNYVSKMPLEQQDINWKKVREEIDGMTTKYNGKKRAKELMKKGALQVVNKFRYRSDVSTKDIGRQIMYNYVDNLFEANCKECIPEKLNSNNADYDKQKIMRKLEHHESVVDRNVDFYAGQLINKETVGDIRKKPNRKKDKEVNLDEDIGIQ